MSGKVSKKGTYVIWTILFAAGFVTAVILIHFAPEDVLQRIGLSQSNAKHDRVLQANGTIETRESGYKYISPLLECDTESYESEPNVADIKQSVSAYVEKQKRERDIVAGFYFRDLNNGPWVGVNEDAVFDPASLLKVPLMMTFLKLSEDNPQILAKEITYSGSTSLEHNVDNKDRLVAGNIYTIEDLIGRMIQLSDNQAFEELSKNVDFDFVRRLHKDIGVTYPTDELPENYMTVRSYASLFRILYNASYLERSTSEKALDVLAHTNFTTGIVAGLPKDITVAHKFGVRDISDSDNRLQLHDCGIVYHPSRPYLICIMTQGKDLDQLVETIKTISELVYKDFE